MLLPKITKSLTSEGIYDLSITIFYLSLKMYSDFIQYLLDQYNITLLYSPW